MIDRSGTIWPIRSGFQSTIRSGSYNYSLGKYLEFNSEASYVSAALQILNAASNFQIGFSLINSYDKWFRLGEAANFSEGWFIYKLSNNRIRIYLGSANDYVTTDDVYPLAKKVLFTFVNGSVGIFVDGVEANTTATGSIPATVTGSAGSFAIGKAVRSNGSGSTGMGVDDFFISTDPSATEAKRLAFFNGENPLSIFANVLTFYDFNDNVQDQGSLQNNGTLVDLTPVDYKEYQGYIQGQYLQTDGVDDRVNIYNQLDELHGVSSASVHLWVKCTHGKVMFFGAVNGFDRFGILMWQDNKIYFQASANPTNSRGTVDFAEYLETWTLVSLVYNGEGATDADKIKGYINGVQQDLSFNNSPPSSLPNGLSANFRINEYLGHLGATGYDDAVITLDQSTPEQILNFYNNGNGADPANCFTNILAYWDFNQADGDTSLLPKIGTAIGSLVNFSGNYFLDR